MSFINKIGSYLWNNLKKVVGITAKEIKDDGIERLKEIAKVAAESVFHVDLDGDGRIAAINEIVDMAQRTGESWGKKLLKNGKDELIDALNHYLDHDLERYLAISRFVAIILKSNMIVPKHKVLNAILEVVLNEIEANK